MQNDLISRSKLLEDLETAAGTAACGQVQAAMLIRDKLAFATDAVKQAEAVDAEPVRHGRWVKCQGKSHVWYCSECGEKINYKQNRRTYNIPEVPVWQKNKRCRNCGAKMDAKED